MPFDVGESINNMADAILRAPIVNTIARNPIYTALMITFVVMLVTMFIFRDADTEDSLFIMCLRSGFWIFLMLLGTLFIHNKVLCSENNYNTKNAAYEGVFDGGYTGIVHNGMTTGILEDSVVPVTVNTDAYSY